MWPRVFSSLIYMTSGIGSVFCRTSWTKRNMRNSWKSYVYGGFRCKCWDDSSFNIEQTQKRTHLQWISAFDERVRSFHLTFDWVWLVRVCMVSFQLKLLLWQTINQHIRQQQRNGRHNLSCQLCVVRTIKGAIKRKKKKIIKAAKKKNAQTLNSVEYLWQSSHFVAFIFILFCIHFICLQFSLWCRFIFWHCMPNIVVSTILSFLCRCVGKIIWF